MNRSSKVPIKKGVFAIINKMKKSYKERALKVKVIEQNIKVTISCNCMWRF